MNEYDHKEIEKKWQKKWAEEELYKTSESSDKPKEYVLDMFPYPSGEGLHVGHPKGYIATDIYSRYKTMRGFNVLHPMGWDAFGLPAENYALKNKVHPRQAVEKNIARYKEQLSIIGFNYDWDREINTTDPAYYKWTQWIFLQLFKHGLAYESNEPINWCPSCKTGLANEDLDNGACERCGSTVEKKRIRQWVLRITDYAERLLNDLDELKEWPEHIKELQRNWIGKSEGAEIDFKIKTQNAKRKTTTQNLKFTVFTTRPDTLFGATYAVLSPEHTILESLEDVIDNWGDVKHYIDESSHKTEIERTAEGKEKTGVELKGVKAINPTNKEEIPIFIADYVLADYGTGAIMAVPAHDERDFQFAKKYELPIRMVICPHYPAPTCPILDEAYTGAGHLVVSGKFDGLSNEEAKQKITEFVGGKMKTTYKLRDWVFSRQRYWGEPIPLIHCEKCGVVPVSEKDLPVVLPEVESYEPTGTGESPLANISEWVNIACPKCGGKGKRETNTMPQWAGSSWYYLAYTLGTKKLKRKTQNYLDDKNIKKLLNFWIPVDMYVGGAEHATRHLIYARFWHKFLYDQGFVSHSEPFRRLKSPGLIAGADGRKMSKRFGNVINPDDVVATYGADTLRLHEMFMGPFEQGAAWSEESIIGPRRFVEKVWRLSKHIGSETDARDESKLHQTIKKVTEDIEQFKFNTAISALMILANEMERKEKISAIHYSQFLILLSPFAPHVAEELWRETLGHKTSIHLEPWPSHDESKIISEGFVITVQMNGKVRDTFTTETELSEDEIKEKALALEKIKKWIDGQSIKKIIYVKNKIVNIVI
ncbi:MAG: leucine--tRNA ligase [Parcubacteria group bacterium]|nr:leucine--tRNA ligase [Parcubacteria group bacterium]